MEIDVRLGEGTIVEAEIYGQVIRTDQPKKDGGGGTSPSPFMYFMASIGACAGYYVLDFCRTRDIPTDNISVKVHAPSNKETHMIEKAEIEILLPPEFPEKYEKAVIRSVELCSVKKHIDKGMAFETRTVRP